MKTLQIFLLVGALIAGLPVSGAGGAVQQKVTVTMTDFVFAPKALTVRPATALEVVLVNKGAVQHEFMLYPMPAGMAMEMDMDKYGAENTYFKGIGSVEVIYPGKKPSMSSRLEQVLVDPGQTVTIKFVARKTGMFEFGCHITGHYEAGMKGTLAVK